MQQQQKKKTLKKTTFLWWCKLFYYVQSCFSNNNVSYGLVSHTWSISDMTFSIFLWPLSVRSHSNHTETSFTCLVGAFTCNVSYLCLEDVQCSRTVTVVHKNTRSTPPPPSLWTGRSRLILQRLMDLVLIHVCGESSYPVINSQRCKSEQSRCVCVLLSQLWYLLLILKALILIFCWIITECLIVVKKKKKICQCSKTRLNTGLFVILRMRCTLRGAFSECVSAWGGFRSIKPQTRLQIYSWFWCN